MARNQEEHARSSAGVHARRIAFLIVAAALLLAGCGNRDHAAPQASENSAPQASKPRVSIAVDRSLTGDQKLLRGPSDDDQQQRVAITPKGEPTVLYAVRVRDLHEGVGLRALSTVTVTKCAETDYQPEERSYTACQYTKPYHYNPVAVRTAFRAVPDANGEPDLSRPGSRSGR